MADDGRCRTSGLCMAINTASASDNFEFSLLSFSPIHFHEKPSLSFVEPGAMDPPFFATSVFFDERPTLYLAVNSHPRTHLHAGTWGADRRTNGAECAVVSRVRT